MWSYKFTSSASVFVDQCRVGVRFEAATPTSKLLALFDAVSKEQRCKCFFFDGGVEKHLASSFKTLLARPDRGGRKRVFVGLTFPPDFPCHRSPKATAQRVSSFIIGVDRFVPWQLDFLVAQSGPRPAVNFLHVSLTSQQQMLTNYSQARQLEVVASLDTAEANDKKAAGKEAAGEEAAGEEAAGKQAAEDASSAHSGVNRGIAETESDQEMGGDRDGGDQTESASTATALVAPTVDADNVAVLSRIALETDMTPAQVTTSWSMHRGHIALHTAGSLNVSESIMPPPTVAKGGARRGSSSDGSLGRRVREVFALLHPLASRPPVYSPNKKFGFELGPAHLEAIEAVDEDGAPGIAR